MWNQLKNILKAPVFEGDENKTGQADLLYTFLAMTAIAVPAVAAASLLSTGTVLPAMGGLLAAVLITTVGLMFLIRSGYVAESGVILTLVAWGIFTVSAYRFGGLHDPAITGFLLVIVLASVIGGWRMLMVFSGLSIFSLISLYILEQTNIISPNIATPSDAVDVSLAVIVIIATAFLLRTFINQQTAARQKARTSVSQIKAINRELKNNCAELAKQTAANQRRAHYLDATAQVAHGIATELDLETLLPKVVSLVSNQFGFYHTGIFLVDASKEYVVLKAASSEGGQRMLERGHRLRIGEQGIVGYVAQDGRSQITLDTKADARYFDNPDLPKTRSEAALPLKIGEQVLGVVDVQSTEPEAFNEDDITVLQTLADQIAVALHTAQLLKKTEESLAAQRRAYSKARRDSWKRFIREEPTIGYRYVQGNVVPLQHKQPIESENLPQITLPVQLSGQAIGQVTAHKPGAQDKWTDDEIAMMETLISQLGAALESARLYQETQQRAAREQLTGKITARIRETLDIETILRTASEEIRRSLGLSEVVIQLGEPPTPEDDEEGSPA